METQESIWNSDNIEHAILFEIKMDYIKQMINWNLDDAYQKLLLLSDEFTAKLNDKEEEELDDLLKELANRRELFNSTEPTSYSTGQFYSELRIVYKFINKLMKKHKIFFREGFDPSRSALRR